MTAETELTTVDWRIALVLILPLHSRDVGGDVVTLESLLFDSWLTLLFVGVLVNFFALVKWRRDGVVRPLQITLALTLVWWVANVAVVTPVERARVLLRDVEDDLLASKTDRIAAALAPDFSAGTMNRDRFIETVRSRLRNIDVRSLTRVRLELLTRADAKFQIGVTYFSGVARGSLGGTVKSLWRIDIAKTPLGWKIRRIEPEEINEMPIPSWDDLPR